MNFSENFLNYSLKHRFNNAFVLPLVKVFSFTVHEWNTTLLHLDVLLPVNKKS